ncbi:MAG: hypothetical protein Q8M16_15745 [Pirellulaceae bacterium]|nr:hypothetical protein [Pirellulaceae bacterium]
MTVASVQRISVPAILLRGFVTFESVDEEPRNALTNLQATKKAAVAALTAIGVAENSIKTTSTKILEWDTAQKALNVYPISNFRPAENEVFGTDSSNLSRSYSIELRFKIE